MKKRSVSLLLATAMVASTLAGCGGGTTSTETTKAEAGATSAEGGKEEVASTEPIEMVSIVNTNIAAEDAVVFEHFLQDGKYAFNVTSLDRTVANEKISIMLSTNQYPEVFFKNHEQLTPSVITKYGQQGTFIPLNDLIEEHAPNLAKILEEKPEIKAAITEEDGNIYSLPSISLEQSGNFPLWVNAQWMENLGLEMPTSMDELYSVLEAFKLEDANGNGDANDEIPVMQSTTPQMMVASLLPYVGQKFDRFAYVVIDENGVLQDMRACDAYKESMAYCAKMYQNGILDKNMFVQTVQQAQAVGQGGDVTGMTGGGSPTTYCGATNAVNYVALTPFHKGSFFINPGYGVGAVVITDACKDPAKVMEWADQMYSEEGSLLVWMGIEGESYEWTNEEKTEYEWIVPEGETVMSIRQKYGLQGTGYVPAVEPEVFYTGSSDEMTRNLYAMKASYLPYCDGFLPILRYTDAEQKTLSTIEADIKAYADTYAAKVITGEIELEATWDEYIAKLEAMGLNQLEEIKQASYDTNN